MQKPFSSLNCFLRINVKAKILFLNTHQSHSNDELSVTIYYKTSKKKKMNHDNQNNPEH